MFNFLLNLTKKTVTLRLGKKMHFKWSECISCVMPMEKLTFYFKISKCNKDFVHSRTFYNIFFSAEKLMYLRLRSGQPIGSKISRDEMINTYGEQKILPDYWFIVTLGRAEVVSDFFHRIRHGPTLTLNTKLYPVN